MLHRSMLAPPLLALMLAACSSTEGYPSLLPRPAESQSLEEPAPAPEAPVAPNPAIDARIGTALQTLDQRIAAFDEAAKRAARPITAAAGAPAGSDRWLDAQVALAELDAARSSTQDISGELQDIAAERALALEPDYPALDAAVERARAAVAAQLDRITQLQQGLAPA
jgi:hypothetical protein